MVRCDGINNPSSSYRVEVSDVGQNQVRLNAFERELPLKSRAKRREIPGLREPKAALEILNESFNSSCADAY